MIYEYDDERSTATLYILQTYNNTNEHDLTSLTI